MCMTKDFKLFRSPPQKFVFTPNTVEILADIRQKKIYFMKKEQLRMNEADEKANKTKKCTEKQQLIGTP